MPDADPQGAEFETHPSDFQLVSEATLAHLLLDQNYAEYLLEHLRCTVVPRVNALTALDLTGFLSLNSIAEIQKDVEYRIPFTVNNSTITVNM